MQPASADAVLGAIAHATNEVTQGWMRVMQSAAPFGTVGAPPGPGAWPVLQGAYLEKQRQLWEALVTGRPAQVASPSPGDRRFAGKAWREQPYFDYVRQSYLLASEFFESAVERAELDPGAKEKLRFATRQWLDALCPANFAATNPEFLRQAMESGGESIARGLANLLADAQNRRIRQTDESAFEVGRNLATTPGEVVFENDLIQLIQYRPRTGTVASRPLLMVPPCINKYYILDLQPESSFAAHAVGEGHTVFMVSWRNVGPELGRLTWDDYLEQGVFAALEAALEITGADRANVLGFCVGGTLLGAALAVMAARGEERVSSATFLATMHDFSEPGQIGLFVDEASVAAREASIGSGGLLSGLELAYVFSSLRANDLVWPYVVNNYLLGGQPAAFDLLYWNSDSTNLPGPMYCYYLRHTYLENRLREPGALVNCGVPVDLRAVKLPAFVLATREDHIVPWRSAYRSTGLLGGECTFVLGASGHVAGIVNPPAKGKRSHWVSGRDSLPADPEAWLSQAREERGSWWPRWSAWLERHRGGERPAPETPGSARHRVIEPAPGRYVRERIH